MDYASIVATIRRLALEAGAAILKVYGQEDFAVRAKSDASPVTEADERADAIICRGLTAAFPEIPIVTEEQQATHGLAPRSSFSSTRSMAPRNSCSAGETSRSISH